MHYEAPTVEVLQLENEGVIAVSGNENLNESNGQWAGTNMQPTGVSNSELEEMVNDLFSIEN